MTTASSATPYGYALRVDGHLDRHWCSRFGDLELTHHDDGTSTLAGPVADQSQLHGLLAGLRDIGATLLSVRPLEQPDPGKRTIAPRSRSRTVSPPPSSSNGTASYALLACERKGETA